MPKPYVFPLPPLPREPYLIAREPYRREPHERWSKRRAANIAQTRRETKAAEAERWKSKFQHAFCSRGNLTVPAATLAKDPSPRAARRANERWAAKPRKPNPF